VTSLLAAARCDPHSCDRSGHRTARNTVVPENPAVAAFAADALEAERVVPGRSGYTVQRHPDFNDALVDFVDRASSAESPAQTSRHHEAAREAL
jgi:hypothetical protein